MSDSRSLEPLSRRDRQGVAAVVDYLLTFATNSSGSSVSNDRLFQVLEERGFCRDSRLVKVGRWTFRRKVSDGELILRRLDVVEVLYGRFKALTEEDQKLFLSRVNCAKEVSG